MNASANIHERHSNRSSRPGRRTGVRFLAASLIAIGGTAAVAGSVSAAPAPPEPESIEEYNPVKPSIPRPDMPSVRIPTAEDLLRDDIVGAKLPEDYTYPDDDADPEHCGDDCDRGEIAEDEVSPHGEDEAYTEDYGEDYPYGCGEDELVECEDEEIVPEDDCDGDYVGEKYPNGLPEGYHPDDCDTPDETTSTTVAPSTTSTTIYDFEEVDVEVQDEVAQRDDGALAFTGSNSLLPLAGAGLLATGVLVAGMSLAARRRADASGEV